MFWNLKAVFPNVDSKPFANYRGLSRTVVLSLECTSVPPRELVKTSCLGVSGMGLEKQ